MHVRVRRLSPIAIKLIPFSLFISKSHKFCCPAKQYRDGNLLQMSLIMNCVKLWFSPGRQCWGNEGRDSLIQKTWANGTTAALFCCEKERWKGSGGARGKGVVHGQNNTWKNHWYIAIRRIYILPRDRPSCAMTVITNGSFLMSGYMFLNCSMQHLFDHLPILISDCLVKR